MDVLDCVEIELIIEGMRQNHFNILRINKFEFSTFREKRVPSVFLK